MNLVAKLGQSIQFVAFCAHAAVAALLVENLPRVAGRSWEWAGAMILFAAVKEYWFDATYEKDPPQSFMDNSEDFVSYLVGAVVGIALGGW